MQVQNNSSQSFNGIRIQTSKMNRVQQAISNSISDALDYLPVYDRACDEALDIYILPARKNAQAVTVRIMDQNSDTFVRDNDRKIMSTEAYSGSVFEAVDNIRLQLLKIFKGDVQRPGHNVDKIIEQKTDLARLRPELYEDIPERLAEYRPYVDEKAARELVADEIVRSHSSSKFEENSLF